MFKLWILCRIRAAGRRPPGLEQLYSVCVLGEFWGIRLVLSQVEVTWCDVNSKTRIAQIRICGRILNWQRHADRSEIGRKDIAKCRHANYVYFLLLAGDGQSDWFDRRPVRRAQIGREVDYAVRGDGREQHGGI